MMKRWRMIVAAGLAFSHAAQAQEPPKQQAVPVAPQAVTSPLVAIYRIAGIRDNGSGAYQGIATAISCTNSSSTSEKIRFLIRRNDGTMASDNTYEVPARNNFTVGTHFAALILSQVEMNTGSLTQGTALIYATTTNITCSAMVVDATTSPTFAVALHLQRFNPISGTQE